MGNKFGAMKAAAKYIGIPFDEYLDHIDKGEKRCSKCKTWKYINFFHKDSSRGDGISTVCIKCRSSPDPYASLRGRVSTFKGKKHTDEAKLKMSKSRKGNKNRVGKKHTKQTKDRISKITKERTPRGKDHHAYKDGKYSGRFRIRKTREYANWRTNVFTRDKYTCQDCGDIKGGNLNAHHIKSFSEYPDLRLDVNNGVTLCRICHQNRHNK